MDRGGLQFDCARGGHIAGQIPPPPHPVPRCRSLRHRRQQLNPRALDRHLARGRDDLRTEAGEIATEGSGTWRNFSRNDEAASVGPFTAQWSVCISSKIKHNDHGKEKSRNSAG